MVVNASLKEFKKRAREKVASAFKQIDSFGKVSSDRCPTAFNRHRLKCAAIEDLNGLHFGRICMQIYIHLEEKDKHSYNTRTKMVATVRSMVAASRLERDRHGQVERFFVHAIRSVFALMEGKFGKDKLRSGLLGYIDKESSGTERVWNSMDKFSKTEINDIKKSIENDFFSMMDE
jgi:hypothetical protein